MLDPQVGNAGVVEWATDSIVLDTVDATGDLPLDGEIGKRHIGTGGAIINVVAIDAHPGASTAGWRASQHWIPRTCSREGDVVDDNMAGD